MERNTPEMTSYRVPLMLSVSKTPLYIKIDCPPNFPISRPNMIVLARVMHKDVHPKTKVISSAGLENWDLYKYGSNLLSALREIHGKFDVDPPMPEKLIN